MANGSLPSLDVSAFAEEAIKREREQDLSGNLNLEGFTDSIIQEEVGRVSAAARWAKEFDPESYAKAQKLAPGLPPDVAARQQPTLEQMQKVNAYSEVFDKAPAIRQHFARFPKDLPNASPDELDQLAGINWTLHAFGDAFGQGQSQSELAMLRWKQMAGTSTPQEDKLADELAQLPSRTFGAEDWYDQALVGLAQSLPMMIQTLAGGAKGAALGATVGGVGGFAAGGVGALPGAVAGASVGGTVGALNESIKLQSGLIYNELRSFKDEAGNPLDPTVAKWASLLAGIGAGGLEQLGLTKTLGKVPGLDRILGTFSADGVKAILKNPLTRAAFARFAKNLGEAVTVETLTEMGQEGFAILAGELAKATSEQDFQMLTTEEAAQRITEAGVQALQVMSLLGPVTAGTRFAADLHTMRQSKRANDNLKKIAIALEGNGFVERAPAVAAQVIDTAAQGQKVYLPAEEVRTLFQEQGQDVYAVPIQNWRQRFDEALATAGDVEVSLGEYITALGSDPQSNPLYTLTRTDPSHYIPADMEEFSAGLDEFLQSELQRSEARISQKIDDSVKKAVTEQFTQFGFTPEAVNHFATVLNAYFNVHAKTLGVEPMQLFQQHLEFAREDMSQTIENGNSMVPSLRRLFQSAYHGSRAIFDRFSTDFMGTGEGAQAFGWGLYFAEDKALALNYRNKLSRYEQRLFVNGELTPLSADTKAYLSGDTFRNADTAGKLDILDAGNKQLQTYIDINNDIIADIDAGLIDNNLLAERELTKEHTAETYKAALLKENEEYLNKIAETEALRALIEQGQEVKLYTGRVLRVKQGGRTRVVSPRARGDDIISEEVEALVKEIEGLREDEQYIISAALTDIGRGKSIEEGLAFIEQQVKMTSLPLISDRAARIERLQSIFTALEPVVLDAGRLYEVNLPDDDQLLLWDRPLSEQDPKVREALGKLGFDDFVSIIKARMRDTEKSITVQKLLDYERRIDEDPDASLSERFESILGSMDKQSFRPEAEDPNALIYIYERAEGSTRDFFWSFGEPASDATLEGWAADVSSADPTGEEIYKQLKERFSTRSNMPESFDATLTRSDQRASLALHDVGILGHKFLDGNSRSAGDGTYNFVIYNDEAIEIKRFYQSGQKLPPVDQDAEMMKAYSGKWEMVPIAWLEKLPGNLLGRSDVDELAKSIEAEGVKSPLIVNVGKNSRTAELGEGNHRLAALKRLGYTHAPVRVVVGREWGEDKGHNVDADLIPVADKYFSADAKPSQVFRSLAEPRALEQSTPEGARGAIEFRKGQPSLIKFFEKADLSTPLHEMSHFFLETTREWAKVSPEIKARWDVIAKHLKVEGDAELTVEQHEQFAKWGEAYFMEGKAPNAELRSAFQAFRRWLLEIYKTIRNLGGSIHPEIAEVFDQMLTLDDRFSAQENDTAYAPLFKDAAEMGVDPEDYLEYQRWVQTWRDEAQEQSISRVVGQQKRLLQAHYKRIRSELTKEATAKLKLLPPYTHREKFKTTGFAMDTEAFAEKYGKESAAAFPREAFNKAGLDPEVVAELLGYPTADEMVHDFRQAPPLRIAAKQMAEQQMVQRYGQDFTEQAILDLAVKQAMANDARVLVLSKEYQVLSRKAGREVTQTAPRQLAQEIAQRTVHRKKVKDINERHTQAAVRRAGSMAEAAMRKGDWAKAADWKRKQLLAQAIDNETQVLNRTLQKIRDKAAKYTKSAPKSIDPGAMEQIRALVTQYHFAKVPLRQIAKTEKLREFLSNPEKLAEWKAKQEAEGLVPQIPEHLLRRAEKLNWKELSVEQLLGLGDTLDNLEHVGRLKHKLRTAKGLREFAAVKEEIRDKIAEAVALRMRPKRAMKTYTEEERRWFDTLNGFHYHFLKPEQIIEFLDAEEIGGPLATAVFEPIAQAQNVKNDMNLEYNSKLIEIFDKFDKGRLTQVVEIRSLGTKMTIENVIAVALNGGNTSNKQKMLEGEVWSEAQFNEIIHHLSDTEMDVIQDIWNLLDELWQKESALERKLTGVAPPKIEGKEFQFKGKTYAGGYYPVIYDFTAQRGLGLIQDITPQDQQHGTPQDLFPKNFTPGTNHKHLTARQKVAKPFRLDLHVLPGHIHNVIHDLAYREAIRGAYKVLWDPDISKDIAEAESPEAVRELRNWLRAVATEHAFENDPTLKFFTGLRTGATMVGMGFRVSTAISQLLGFLPALTRVGARTMTSALIQVVRNRTETLEMVHGLSGELKHRFNNQDREIRETVNSLLRKRTFMDKLRAVAFVHIGALDQVISTATWLAAYQEQMERNPKDQDLARQHGDRIVRLTQGTGTIKDFAGIMNSGGFLRLFTMFYSFFSAQYAMQSRLTRQTIRDIRQGNWEDVLFKRLPDWTKLVVLPAVLGALITGQGPEDDENLAAWTIRRVLLYPLAAIPLVRELTGFTEGYSYRMTPVSKFGEQAGRALYNLIPDERRDWQPEKAIEPAAAVAAIALRLPIDQGISTTKAVWQGVANDDLTLGDILFGRRDK